MADRADAADARGDEGISKTMRPSQNFSKAAEFVDVHVGPLDLAGIVHVDGDLGVAFNPGYGFNRYFLCCHSLPLFSSATEVCRLETGLRPWASSLRT
jgi:hypothetical protein